VTVMLRRGPGTPGVPGLSTIASVPLSSRRYLSRADFARGYGARADDLAQVREFAERRGFELRETAGARRAVRLAGPADRLARAFGVSLRRLEHPGGAFRGRRGVVVVPPEIRDAVVGVFGLDARPLLRPHVRRATDPSVTGYPVTAVAAAYGFPPALTGAGQCVGVLEFGGGFAAADLERFFAGLGLRGPTPVVVGVDGATNAPTGAGDGPDAEVELDLEIVGALAPAAELVAYFAPNTEQGFVDALTTAVHDAEHRPSVVSISWGAAEETWSLEARAALETAAQDGALQGVTVVAASGDQGAADGEPAGTRAVDFPASSPYVLGGGGTRLTLVGGTVEGEVVWNDLAEGEGATGGGVSEAFPLPSYQDGVGVPGAPNGFVGRGVPDVAADADPDTGYATIVDGAPAVLGGTSAVAPLWAALLARFAEGLGRPLGYANPLLYAPSARGGFRPITAGNNDGYSAGPGWNPCAGLGSPRAALLLQALQA